MLVDVLDACFVRCGKARVASTSDAGHFEESHFMPEGDVSQVVLDGPTFEVGRGHLFITEPGDGRRDASAGGINLEEQLVSISQRPHIPWDLRHSRMAGMCSR